MLSSQLKKKTFLPSLIFGTIYLGFSCYREPVASNVLLLTVRCILRRRCGFYCEQQQKAASL